MNQPKHRSSQEVLDDHLRESLDGLIEDDLARNYSKDLVVLTGRGVFRGHDGLRHMARFFAGGSLLTPSATR